MKTGQRTRKNFGPDMENGESFVFSILQKHQLFNVESLSSSPSYKNLENGKSFASPSYKNINYLTRII